VTEMVMQTDNKQFSSYSQVKTRKPAGLKCLAECINQIIGKLYALMGEHVWRLSRFPSIDRLKFGQRRKESELTHQMSTITDHCPHVQISLLKRPSATYRRKSECLRDSLSASCWACFFRRSSS